MITERDEDVRISLCRDAVMIALIDVLLQALAFLIDLKLEYLLASSPGYKLYFHFAPNKYFTNDVLTKTYHYLVRFLVHPLHV